MMTSHDLAIQQLHDHFKAHGQVAFRHCSSDPLRPGLCRVSFDMKNGTGATLLTLALELELDEAQLRAELSTVDLDGRLDILHDKKRMDGFMEASAFELIKHLRTFNGRGDDHAAIALLVHEFRGTVALKNEFKI